MISITSTLFAYLSHLDQLIFNKVIRLDAVKVLVLLRFVILQENYRLYVCNCSLYKISVLAEQIY